MDKNYLNEDDNNICGLRNEIFNKPKCIDTIFDSCYVNLDCSIEDAKSKRDIQLHNLNNNKIDLTILKKEKNTSKKMMSKKKLQFKPSILYVYEEESNLKKIESSLKKQFNIFSAINLLEAKSILKKEKINIIISDIKMNIIDGIYVLKYVKRYYPKIKRFLVSSFSNEVENMQIIGKDIASKIFNKTLSVNDIIFEFDNSI